MKTIDQIRLDNLELLISELGSADAVAEMANTSPVYLSQIRNRTPDSKTKKPREMGGPLARKLEECCGKEIGWMDNHHHATTYRQQQFEQTLRVMEDMPAWQLDQAIKIIEAIAAPPAPEQDPAQRDYTDPATYPKSAALVGKKPRKTRIKKA